MTRLVRGATSEAIDEYGGVSVRLDFVVKDGDQVARLNASAWPRNARFSNYKAEILALTGVFQREGAGVRFRVANGSAVYRVIGEHDHEIALELVEGKLIWPG